jgi:hypothetical protein
MVWGLREKREAEEDGPGGRANKAAVVEAWLASAVNKPAADLGEGLKLNGHDRSPQGRLVAFWVLNRWLEGIKGAYMLVCLVLFAYRYRHHVLVSCRIMCFVRVLCRCMICQGIMQVCLVFFAYRLADRSNEA